MYITGIELCACTLSPDDSNTSAGRYLRTVFLAILVFQAFVLAAQSDSARGQLLSNFYQEGSNNEFHQQTPVATRSALPPQLWSLSNPAAIGISDPGLDSATALRQAFLRSLFVKALAKASSIQMVAENFKSLKESANGVKTRFEEMYTVTSTLQFDSLPQIKEVYRLTNGETIVVLDETCASTGLVRSSDSADQPASHPDTAQPSNAGMIETVCTLYHLEVAADRSQQVFRTEYSIKPSNSDFLTDEELFGYTSVNGRWCNFTSVWNGKEMVSGNTRYYYFTSNPPPPPDSTLVGKLGMASVEGLWPALITGILWQITGIDADSNTTIKQVADNYNQTRRDLSRVVESHNLLFKINKLAYESGKLFTLIDIEIIQNYQQ